MIKSGPGKIFALLSFKFGNGNGLKLCKDTGGKLIGFIPFNKFGPGRWMSPEASVTGSPKGPVFGMEAPKFPKLGKLPFK